MSYEVKEILIASVETLYLLLVTGLFAVVLGMILGFILFFTENKKEIDNKLFVKIIYKITSLIVDITRSIPFIILMIILIPFTLLITGTMLGANAALPALIISASPFYARIVYMALKDIDKGKIEALEAMGASNFRILLVLIKEAMPSLITGLTITLVTLVGFIAAAGAIGAGGLGDLAKKKAFNEEFLIAYICVILVLFIVFSIQFIGDKIVKKIDKR